MGEVDIRTNEYMRDNEHFADVFNYFLFDGQRVIEPENLHELDRSAAVFSFGPKSGKASVLEKSRDVVKSAVVKSDGTTTYQLLGVENQTNVHYAMPVRNMLYDAISYTNQVDAIAVRNRKGSKEGLTGAEFLSGFTKEDHLYPVITLVLYWSPDFWDGPHSLHEMLEPGNDDILKFVSDYRLNILSPADIPKSGFKKFTSPISEVFQYIQGSADKEELNRILQENPNFRHLDRESAELINAVTKSDLRFEEGEETIDMCTAIQQMRDESVSFGMKEGRKEGREEGMDDMAVVIQRLYDSGRTGDMQRALTDRDYLDQLIAEFCGKK